MLYENYLKLIKDFDISKYITNQNYYESSPAITERTFNDSTKPNNKLVNNYAAYIVDIIQGFFIGKPISYTCEDQEYLNKMQEVLDNNDSRVLDAQIAKQVGIKGKCFEIIYIDEKSEIQIAKINPENIICIYDNSIKPKMIGVIRVWQDNDINYFEVYDEEKIIYGKYNTYGKDTLNVISENYHYFGEIPVIEYINNEEHAGDFEKVKTLIDAYDKSRSDTSNDFEYFTDAYMKLKGCNIDLEADADGVTTMKKNRLLMLPEGGDADFLIKNINDTALENHNNRLREDIHKFSFTPDLTDSQFAGNISGIALQFKLFGLEQIAQTKENYMRLGLKKRLRLITKILNIKGNNYNSNDIVMNFTRNMPINISEIVNTMLSLKGTISEQTILSNLPFIEDPAYEKELLKKENDMMGIDETLEKTTEEETGEEVEEDAEENIGTSKQE